MAGRNSRPSTGARRPRRVEPRAHRRRDAPSLGRSRPHRSRPRGWCRAGRGHCAADPRFGEGHRRLRAETAGMTIRALVFDVFGTLVDWRSGVAREARRLLCAQAPDWMRAPSPMRGGALPPSMETVRSGTRPLSISTPAAESCPRCWRNSASQVSREIRAELVQAWHRLDAWPEVPRPWPGCASASCSRRTPTARYG